MKWWAYLISLVLIVAGVICGVQYFKKVSAESYVNGSIDIDNKFVSESFNYTASSLSFNEVIDDTAEEDVSINHYYYTINLLPIESFDGDKFNYSVTLNGCDIYDANISLGAILFDFELNFYSPDGALSCESIMHCNITFLNNKTVLRFDCYGEDNKNYLESYFDTNGIRLTVLESTI